MIAVSGQRSFVQAVARGKSIEEGRSEVLAVNSQSYDIHVRKIGLCYHSQKYQESIFFVILPTQSLFNNT